MVQYLTKEEVKQWRSSLEKITLEEFARRLGKEIEENKRTHDIVDMLVNNEAVSTTDDIKVQEPAEQTQTKAVATQQAPVKTVSSIVFSKALTEREQRVFDYLLEKKGESVKAQDLACVLDIPLDYIYMYIRNLRKKMAEDLLVNSDEGGFILNV